jgi:hypothetical protein
MVVNVLHRLGTRSSSFRGREPDLYFFQQQVLAHQMSEPVAIPRSASEPAVHDDATAVDMTRTATDGGSSDDTPPREPLTPTSSHPGSPSLRPNLLHSRNSSFVNSGSFQEDWEAFPPLDKLTFFDIFENTALPSQLEKWQATLAAQREKVKKQQQRLRTTGANAKDRAVSEWRKRVPTADEQLDKYRKRVKKSVDALSKRWSDTAAVTAREKLSFISSVLNIFISGYLIGAWPAGFYYWFTLQVAYFMPIRYFTYHRKGYHYFLFDLCYFVNLLTMLTIWAFPRSKRLFISTYCLAYGNNAVAIAMWRNSMVFHSLDKVTSLFIHIMPPVTLHCLVHLTPAEILRDRFPAVYNIKFSEPGSPEHYSLSAMITWATIPYAVWQLSYHFFITVRRREKIAAGRPTSFTWLRRSYSKTAIGRFVLSLPEPLQEPAFMLIQYCYALLTMIPCSLWFWSRWASAAFLLGVFVWSIWNGANYYMDVFGKKFQNELEQMKKDVAKWQSSPNGGSVASPPLAPEAEGSGPQIQRGFESIPLLQEESTGTKSTAVEVDESVEGGLTERKVEAR